MGFGSPMLNYKYEGRYMNKLQNDIFLLIYKI